MSSLEDGNERQGFCPEASALLWGRDTQPDPKFCIFIVMEGAQGCRK